MGDKISFAAPKLIELGKNAAWTWDDLLVSMDMVSMITFYEAPANCKCFWQPKAGAPKFCVSHPQMLVLPPDCVAFCATAQSTSAELFAYITQVLKSAKIIPVHFTLVHD